MDDDHGFSYRGSLRKTEGQVVFIEWNIVDFKSLWNTYAHAPVTSPLFQVEDGTWILEILQGSKGPEEFEEIVVVNLRKLQSETKHHSITFQLTVEINGKEICRGYRKNWGFGEIGFSEMGFSHYHTFVKEKELLQHMSKSNDLTVLCTVFPKNVERTSEAISKDGVIRGMQSSKNFEGADILVSQMKDLFLKGENCDFLIRVKGREFQVHKAILSARSPVLSAMLSHDMAEKNRSISDIVDCEPVVFEHFLLYLYTGQVADFSWENVTSLYVLGDKYDLEHLRKECVAFMEGNMCIDAFCDAISLAVKHNESTLVKCAEKFFLKKVSSIIETNKWQLLMNECPVICNELFIKYTKNCRVDQP